MRSSQYVQSVEFLCLRNGDNDASFLACMSLSYMESYGKEHYANVRYETCGSRSAAEIMAGCFYPSNLLVSELLECRRGGRELSQALHLSSSLCLRCKAVAGEHVRT